MDGGIPMNEIMCYNKAVEIIKTAILQSWYDAARSVTETSLRHQKLYLQTGVIINVEIL